jgi:hypothetical protein
VPRRSELVATFHPGGHRAELIRLAAVTGMKGLGDVAAWELAAL